MKRTVLGIGAALFIGAAVGAGAVAVAQNAPNPKNDFILSGKDTPFTPYALWTENGKSKVARGAADVAKAPKDAARLDIKVFNYMYGGNIREAHLKKGTKYQPPGGHLTVIYVQKGHLRVTEGGITGDVYAGDTIAEYDGRPTTIEVMEDTVNIEASWENPPAK